MSNTRFIRSARFCWAASLLFLCAAVRGEESLWTSDFAGAKAKAKAEKKLLLIDFTGSDWCGWCIKLHNEVFDLPPFKEAAPKKFVLVELDYPNKKVLPKNVKAQNRQLQMEYNVNGYPTVLLLDPEGQKVAKTGYLEGGPEKYLKALNELIAAHDDLVALQGKLPDAKGLDRAKLLDQILETQDKLGLLGDEEAKYTQEIMTLDADNKAGLKTKYTFKGLLTKATAMGEDSKFDEAKAALEKALALPGLTGEQKQDAYSAKGGICIELKDFASAVACLTQARAAAPENPQVAEIDSMIKQYGGMADAQSAVTKLKTAVEGAKGVDRAKILDQLIDEQTKFDLSTQARKPSKEIEKWAAEIVTLDVENEAGLKAKYEFRVGLAGANKLFKTQDYEKSEETLTKILALPGLTDAQKALVQKLKKKLEAHAAKAAPKPDAKALPKD